MVLQQTLFDMVALFFNSTWGFIAFIAISVLLIFVFSKHKKVFVITLLLALALSIGMKTFVGQARPCITQGSEVPCPASEGFPSNHAVIGIVLALGALGTMLFWPYVFLAVIISLSRLWLGVHTLDQVAGGMALGAMVFLAVYQIEQRLYGRYLSRFDLDELLDENLLTKQTT